MGAHVSVEDDKKGFVVHPSHGCGPSFPVRTIHISCQSDTYLGSDHKYGGIILYARNGQTDWYTANGTHCKSGYVIITRTDTREFEELQRRWCDEPGRVHGIIYRKAFGESCKYHNVVGEGFGIVDGRFKMFSGALNLAHGYDFYHDASPYMNSDSSRCVRAMVFHWQIKHFPERQNYNVEELIAFGEKPA